ncbi:cytochrome P450 [Aspergillus fijiensis CBS 313.89]|uniref:Putative cytochrome P450 monooxygenase n=1 Tax=Aspergillus fijiensis CBS 313.89 TaxID=1448319 RepID=A0A8G1S306_9EURO|nr:putative cytochrome P450 monooxygenase [Aspergillus fijiensis CBS 313.89]RAK82556.1 putative cytochrome P450 monooxygenase [Aspergillus fijiensis CBS 313.89]
MDSLQANREVHNNQNLLVAPLSHWSFSHNFFAIFYIIGILTGAKLVYNVYLHPLRSHPGPILARATRLYMVLLELRGCLHLRIKEWHDQYGEVVRIAPDSLSYNSGQAWNEICGHRTRDTKAVFEKDQDFFTRPPNGQWSVVAANGDYHRRLRRLLSHAFSEKALRAQEPALQHYVDLLIRQLHHHADQAGGSVVDIVQWFNFTTFDIIGDLAFGDTFGLLYKGVWSRYLAAITGLMDVLVYFRAAKYLLPSPWSLWAASLWAPRHLQQDRIYIYQLAKGKLSRRVEHKTERQDFVHYMLKGSRSAIGPEGLSFEEMVTQGQTLIIAGSETTATVLSGTMYYLLTTPRALSRVTQEIRAAFSDERDITVHRAAQLPYLHAVLEESLRMYPPVPGILPRVTPAPGQLICGRFVPAGTSVGLHHWACYRSTRNFSDPDTFWPERWMAGEDDARFAKDDRGAFHPFSYGPRNCLGRNLAYAELQLIVSKLFWNFDAELMPGGEGWANQRTTSLWMKKALPVRLIPRQYEV